jgi:cyanophycinase
MSSWILASGGNEFSSEYKEADSKALSLRNDLTSELLVVVTAPYPTQDLAYETAKNYFSTIGIKTKKSNILSHEDLNSSNINELENAQSIYFAGGTPSRLTKTFINTKAEDAIRTAIEKGTVIMGSSAGAMLFGKTVVMPSGQDLGPGLNLLKDQIVLAHFSGTWPSWIKGYREQGISLIGLSEGGSVLTSVTDKTESLEFGKVFSL